MSRRRVFFPGASHHVIHRGNNRMDIFVDDQDRRHFLWLVRTLARKRAVFVHGYVLMKTHFHLLVSTREENALSRLMQQLGSMYVRYFNERYRRTGTLWEGRYRATIIRDERYWLTCLRYIELNPVRAGITASPLDYEWSSARANSRGETDLLVTPHSLYLQLGLDMATRAAAWSTMMGHPLSEADLTTIRSSTQRGRPLGEAEDSEDLRVAS